MSFKKLEITKKGRELLAKAGQGNKIYFKMIEFGDGTLTGNIEDLEGIISLKTDTATTTERVGEKVKVSGSFKNKKEGFYWREIGVYAQADDGSETILFAYQNAGDLAEFIPSTASELVEKFITVEFKFDTIANVEIKMGDSMVYVTKKEFEEKYNSLEEKMNTKIKGEVPKMIFETIYPVGSIFITANNFNPSTILGEWEKIEGRYLLSTPKQLNAGDRSSDEVEADGWGFEIPKNDLPIEETEVNIRKGAPTNMLKMKEGQDNIYVKTTPPWFAVNVWHRIK